jgi:hypothetical protein
VEFLIVLVVLTIVVLIVTAPLRRAGRRQAGKPDAVGEENHHGVGRGRGVPAGEETSSAIAELEAERDAKYREIRDAELDHRTGKLSDSDYDAVDRALRAEAIEILHQLDRARGVDPDSTGEGGRPPDGTG